jgi:hypothetical protein
MVLEQIQRTLTQANGAAEAREASLVKPALTGVSFLSPEVPAKYWVSLDKKVAVMEAPLKALDETLESEELDARKQLAEIADLRRRLADWAGRAIG